jgi:hypothetical protein
MRMATLAVPSGGSKTVVLKDGSRHQVTDDEMVLARYISEQRGGRQIIGAHTGIRYGNHSPDDVFLVHRRDLAGSMFQEVRVEAVMTMPAISSTTTPTPPPAGAGRPAMQMAAPPDMAQVPEDGGLPPGLAQIVDPRAATIRPVVQTPQETGQFMEPERLSVDQIRALIGRPSTSTAMLRTMLDVERKSERARADVVAMLDEKIKASEKK